MKTFFNPLIFLACILFGVTNAIICYNCEETSIDGTVQSDRNCRRLSWTTEYCFEDEMCIFSITKCKYEPMQLPPVITCPLANSVTRTRRKCASSFYCKDKILEDDWFIFKREMCIECSTDFCNEDAEGDSYLVIILAVLGVLVVVGILVGLVCCCGCCIC